MYEIADVVIDNCCPYGDVIVDIPGMPEKAGSASSIAGAMIAQSLTVEIIGRLEATSTTGNGSNNMHIETLLTN